VDNRRQRLIDAHSKASWTVLLMNGVQGKKPVLKTQPGPTRWFFKGFIGFSQVFFMSVCSVKKLG